MSTETKPKVEPAKMPEVEPGTLRAAVQVNWWHAESLVMDVNDKVFALGLECRLTEHKGFFVSSFHFTITGPMHRLREMQAWFDERAGL